MNQPSTGRLSISRTCCIDGPDYMTIELGMLEWANVTTVMAMQPCKFRMKES